MHQDINWDDAYDNRKFTPNAAQYADKWAAQAAKFRQQLGADNRATLDIEYGASERQKFDIFYPTSAPKGLAIYIHGGYWFKFDKNTWSHLAQGAIDNGYAVAIPSYDLSPQVEIWQITQQIENAIAKVAALVEGDIFIAGHSAGGHLACRLICQNSGLTAEVQTRIKSVLSISGVYDLRPLLKTQMNDLLKLTEATALAESPCLLRPITSAKLTCIAGTAERTEFIRQNELMANIWVGLGVETNVIRDVDKNHFTVIEALTDPNSVITNAFLGG